MTALSEQIVPVLPRMPSQNEQHACYSKEAMAPGAVPPTATPRSSSKRWLPYPSTSLLGLLASLALVVVLVPEGADAGVPPTRSPTVTVSESTSRTHSPTNRPSRTNSPSPSNDPSNSESNKPTTTRSNSDTFTRTPSSTFTLTFTMSFTPTEDFTPSFATRTQEVTDTASTTASESFTTSDTFSDTSGQTLTETESTTWSDTWSDSETVSDSQTRNTFSDEKTWSDTSTWTTTDTFSGTAMRGTQSDSITMFQTGSRSRSGASATPTSTHTESITRESMTSPRTGSETITEPTLKYTADKSQTLSETLSESKTYNTFSQEVSGTDSPTATRDSASASSTDEHTLSFSETISESQSKSSSATITDSVTGKSQTDGMTETRSLSVTHTPRSPTSELSASAKSPTHTKSMTGPARSATKTFTRTPSLSPSQQEATQTDTTSKTSSATATHSLSETGASASLQKSPTSSDSLSESFSSSETEKATPTDSKTGRTVQKTNSSTMPSRSKSPTESEEKDTSTDSESVSMTAPVKSMSDSFSDSATDDFSLTLSRSTTESESVTDTLTPSASPNIRTLTKTQSDTPSESLTPNVKSMTLTETQTMGSASAAESQTDSVSSTQDPSLTYVTHTLSLTESITRTDSPTADVKSQTVSVSKDSPTASQSSFKSLSASDSETSSSSFMPTETVHRFSRTHSVSVSLSQQPQSQTTTDSQSMSQQDSSTKTFSASRETPSATETVTGRESATDSSSGNMTLTETLSHNTVSESFTAPLKSVSDTDSASAEPTVTFETPSSSVSFNVTQSFSDTMEAGSRSVSTTSSGTASFTATDTPTYKSFSAGSTESRTGTASRSTTGARSATLSDTQAVSTSFTPTIGSRIVTQSQTKSYSDWRTRTATDTAPDNSATKSFSMTVSDSVMISRTFSFGTPTVSHPRSASRTRSYQVSDTESPSDTATKSPPSASVSSSLTASVSVSMSHATRTASIRTKTSELSSAVTQSNTKSPTTTLTDTPTITKNSFTFSKTPRIPRTGTKSRASLSRSLSISYPHSDTESLSVTKLTDRVTFSESLSKTLSATNSEQRRTTTDTVTKDATASKSQSPQQRTPTTTDTAHLTLSVSHDILITSSVVGTPSDTITQQLTLSNSKTPTPTTTHTLSVMVTDSETQSRLTQALTSTETRTWSAMSASLRLTTTEMATVTQTILPTPSPSPSQTVATPTQYASKSVTVMISNSSSLSITHTAGTKTFTLSHEATIEESLTDSMTATLTQTLSLSFTTSTSNEVSRTATLETDTINSNTLTESRSWQIHTGTHTVTNEMSVTESPSRTLTQQVSRTLTQSQNSHSFSSTNGGFGKTFSKSKNTNPVTMSDSAEPSASESRSQQLTATPTNSAATVTPSFTGTEQLEMSPSITVSATLSTSQAFRSRTPSETFSRSVQKVTFSDSYLNTTSVTPTDRMRTGTESISATRLSQVLSSTETSTETASAPARTGSVSLNVTETEETISVSYSDTTSHSTSDVTKSPPLEITNSSTAIQSSSDSLTLADSLSALLLISDTPSATERVSTTLTFSHNTSISLTKFLLSETLTGHETGSRSLSRTETDQSATRTPPGTPTPSLSITADPTDQDSLTRTVLLPESPSRTESITHTGGPHTVTRSQTVTDTPSVETFSSVVTLSASVTISRTVSITPDTKSPTKMDTDTETFTAEETLTFSETDTPSDSVSLNVPRTPTPSISYSDTSSSTFDSTGTDTFSRSARSKSKTNDATLTKTASAFVTVSDSDSLTSSAEVVSVDSFFVVTPKLPGTVARANRIMALAIIGAPIAQLGDDEVAIATLGTACADEYRDNMTFLALKPIHGALMRNQNFVTRNWTVYPQQSGLVKVCYFLAIKNQWYHIARPGLISIVPTVTVGAIVLVNPYLGEGPIAIDCIIFGSNATNDVFGLVPFGRDCNAPVAMFMATEFGYVNATAGQLRLKFPSLLIKSAADYTLCFRGFPHRRLNGFTQVSAARIRLIGSITATTLREEERNGIRVGRHIAFAVNGVGLSVLDQFFLTNASDRDRNTRCHITTSVTGSHVVTHGHIQRLDGSGSNHLTLSNYIVGFYLRIPYVATLCYKSNTSNRYLYVTETYVEPVMATTFTPNVTTRPSLVWASESDVALTFFGIDIDNKYDEVLLVLNATTACNASSANASRPMLPRGTSSVSGSTAFIAPGLAGAGQWAVCYRSNVSVYRTAGVITVLPWFYDESEPATWNVFNRGVTVGDVLDVAVFAEGFQPLSDLSYMVPRQMACTAIPPSVAVSPSLATNSSVQFATSARGYFQICWVLATGSVVPSQAITVFQANPTTLEPAIIGVTLPTVVLINRVQLQDGDTVFLCDSSLPSRVEILQSQTVRITVNATGSFDVCYRSGLATLNAPVAAPVVIATRLGVSPLLLSVNIFPAALFVGTEATIVLRGVSLSSDGAVYLCNESLAHIANFTLLLDQSNDTTQVWVTSASEAGAMRLCYSYGALSAFPDGPMLGGSVTLNVDPTSLTFAPLVIAASIPQIVRINGESVRGVFRVFIRLNTSHDCSLQTVMSTDTFLAAAGAGAWNASILRRGVFSICFAGVSGRVYPLQAKITVTAHLMNITATQANTLDGLLYVGYPITVTISGGALDYASDSFALVSGSSCVASFVTVPLTSSQPPLVQTAVLSLTAVVPLAGSYRLCYSFGAAVAATIVPFTAIVVITSLVFFGNTLTLVGPAARAAPVYLFSFALPSPAGIVVNYTSIGQSTSQPFVSLRYVPFGVASYRASLLQTNGVASSHIAVQASLAPNVSLCTNFPQSLASTDIVQQYASSVVALYNYLAVNCKSNTPVDYLLGPSLLLSQFMNLVGNAQSLVVDSYSFLYIVGAVTESIPQNSAAKVTLLQSALSNTLRLLQVPDSQITPALLQGFVSLVDSIFSSIEQTQNSPTANLAALQSLGVEAFQRLQLVASRYCSTGMANSGVNLMLKTVSFGVLQANPSRNPSPAIALGNGAVTTPNFWTTASGASVAIMAANMQSNIFPQLPSTGGAKRLFGTAALVLPDFTFPVMTFSLPAVSPLSGNAFAGINTVAFRVSYPPIQLDLSLPFNGYDVKATFYRFSPVPTGASTSGAWVQETNAVATADATTISVTYLMNETVAKPLVGNYFLLSGTYAVSQRGAVLSTRVTDAYYAALVCVLAALHVVGCIWAAIADRQADKKAAKGSRLHKPKNPLDQVQGASQPDAAAEPADEAADMSLAAASTAAVSIAGSPTVAHEPLADSTPGGNTLSASAASGEAAVAAAAAPAPKPWNAMTVVYLHRYMAMWTRAPLHPVRSWARVTSAFTFIFAVALFNLLVLEAAPWEHPVAMNIAYGIAAAVVAAPFGILTRIGLLQHLRDYVSGISAVAGITAAVIATITYNALAGVVAAAVIGYLAALLSAWVFARRWSFAPCAADSRAPVVLGVVSHIIVEAAGVGFPLYMTLVSGVPKPWVRSFAHLQTFAWAIAFDCFVAEPLRAKGMIFLEGAHQSYLHYLEKQKVLATERTAARAEQKREKALRKAEEAKQKAKGAEQRNPYEIDDKGHAAAARDFGGDDLLVEPKDIDEIVESEEGDGSSRRFDSVLGSPVDDDDDDFLSRQRNTRFGTRPPTFAGDGAGRGRFGAQARQRQPEVFSADLDEVSDFPDDSDALETDIETIDDDDDLPDAAPAPFNTRPMLVFENDDGLDPARRRTSLRFSGATPTPAAPSLLSRRRSMQSLDEVSNADLASEKDIGLWVDDMASDGSSDGSVEGDWEEFRLDDEAEGPEEPEAPRPGENPLDRL